MHSYNRGKCQPKTHGTTGGRYARHVHAYSAMAHVRIMPFTSTWRLGETIKYPKCQHRRRCTSTRSKWTTDVSFTLHLMLNTVAIRFLCIPPNDQKKVYLPCYTHNKHHSNTVLVSIHIHYHVGKPFWRKGVVEQTCQVRLCQAVFQLHQD